MDEKEKRISLEDQLVKAVEKREYSIVKLLIAQT
jgi:hypothetical protein